MTLSISFLTFFLFFAFIQGCVATACCPDPECPVDAYQSAEPTGYEGGDCDKWICPPDHDFCGEEGSSFISTANGCGAGKICSSGSTNPDGGPCCKSCDVNADCAGGTCDGTAWIGSEIGVYLTLSSFQIACCTTHDNNYAKCGKRRAIADWGALNCWWTACAEYVPSWWQTLGLIGGRDAWTRNCQARAHLAYTAMRKHGCSAWRVAQQCNCGCCKPVPSTSTSSSAIVMNVTSTTASTGTKVFTEPDREVTERDNGGGEHTSTAEKATTPEFGKGNEIRKRSVAQCWPSAELLIGSGYHILCDWSLLPSFCDLSIAEQAIALMSSCGMALLFDVQTNTTLEAPPGSGGVFVPFLRFTCNAGSSVDGAPTGFLDEDPYVSEFGTFVTAEDRFMHWCFVKSHGALRTHPLFNRDFVAVPDMASVSGDGSTVDWLLLMRNTVAAYADQTSIDAIKSRLVAHLLFDPVVQIAGGTYDGVDLGGIRGGNTGGDGANGDTDDVDDDAEQSTSFWLGILLTAGVCFLMLLCVAVVACYAGRMHARGHAGRAPLPMSSPRRVPAAPRSRVGSRRASGVQKRQTSRPMSRVHG